VLKSAWGWSQGFDVYDDTMESRERVRGVPERRAKDTTDRAIALLERYQADPLFLWVHYEDPHAPYTPPGDLAQLFDDPSREPRLLRLNHDLSGQGGIPIHQQLDSERDYHFYVARYDAEIRYLDRELGRLFDRLELLGLYDRALIVLTADHGEAMGEKDYYFAHIEHLFHGLLHVPLILRYGSELSGRRADFVQLLDVLPTILAVAGIDADPGLRGHDLRAAPAAGVEIYSEQPNGPTPRRSLLVNGLKLVTEPGADRSQLYDVRVDPGETRDLSAEPPYRQAAADLARRLAGIEQQDRLKLAPAGAAVPLTDAESERLRALGYAR
jgi:arylsulfatase A-like enzyme